MREKLPKGYKWGAQWPKKRNKKGRAMGEMMIGIKKEVMEEGEKIETKTEGLMVGKVKREDERWRIVGIYVSKVELGRRLQELERWMRTR